MSAQGRAASPKPPLPGKFAAISVFRRLETRFPDAVRDVLLFIRVVLDAVRDILFSTRDVPGPVRDVLFSAKDILFLIKDVLFSVRDILFWARDVLGGKKERHILQIP